MYSAKCACVCGEGGNDVWGCHWAVALRRNEATAADAVSIAPIPSVICNSARQKECQFCACGGGEDMVHLSLNLSPTLSPFSLPPPPPPQPRPLPSQDWPTQTCLTVQEPVLWTSTNSVLETFDGCLHAHVMIQSAFFKST